jgi:uncharacterized membrane protein YhaH (DUF805 family)
MSSQYYQIYLLLSAVIVTLIVVIISMISDRSIRGASCIILILSMWLASLAYFEPECQHWFRDDIKGGKNV